MIVWAANNFGDTLDGSLAGPTGLVVILFLAAGTIFLIRSMNARLRRLPERFPSDGTEVTERPDPRDPRVPPASGTQAAP
jgi:hypothetical protein